MQKYLPDGRQHVVGLLVEGDMFGRAFDGDMHFSLEAATDAEVYTFPRPTFESILLRSPELDRLLLLNLLNELDRARDWMIILANSKVRGRLAGFLLLLCTRFGHVPNMISVANERLRVQIPLSRPDVAHLLGTRIESVSRGFHALANDGLIEILRPDLIELCNLEELAEEAGEPDIGDQAAHEVMRLSLRQTLS
jgi:CRP/FNR family transcriptional regulator